ncbi:hypothetical protein B296_00001332 [Ensete ventricosum]|uniref:Uncharacterized protein n=1 Tax=Ensete ventricosum TaxID=4639 RepID=A0A426ZAK9_ENSVE|nr:hypothetical protein B296_00001332 [Ensete ventricosum]
MMWLDTRLECIGSSPRVSGACQDGMREFAGRRPKLAERLSGVTERLAESWEEIPTAEPPVSDGCTTATQDFGWLSMAKLPLHWILGTFNG